MFDKCGWDRLLVKAVLLEGILLLCIDFIQVNKIYLNENLSCVLFLTFLLELNTGMWHNTSGHFLCIINVEKTPPFIVPRPCELKEDNYICPKIEYCLQNICLPWADNSIEEVCLLHTYTRFAFLGASVTHSIQCLNLTFTSFGL